MYAPNIKTKKSELTSDQNKIQKSTVGRSDGVGMIEMDENSVAYRHVGLSIFQANPLVPVDVFVRRAAGKFTHVFARETSFDMEQVKNYEVEGQYPIFIRNSDIAEYQHSSMRALGPILSDTARTAQDKAHIVHDLLMLSLHQLYFELNVTVHTLEQVYHITEQMVEHLSKDALSLAMLISSFKRDERLCRHAVTVSALSMLLATHSEYNTRRDVLTVALGGLFHDIGLLALPKEIREKDPEQLSSSELALYQRHPLLGSDMLSTSAALNQTVGRIAAQHHERFDGSGYPNALEGQAIHPLARIVAIADTFNEMTVKNGQKRAIHPLKSLDMMNGMKGVFDPQLLFKFTFLFFPADEN
jgi:HD-GYP domain-containing protein (c-di-GMP phosphodiesterase class II)